MSKYKAISKNEQKFVSRWVKSMSEADDERIKNNLKLIEKKLEI